MLPPVIPSIILDINKTGIVLAAPSKPKEAAVPRMEMTRTGRLPNLSDNLPKMGAEIIWNKEYVAVKRPIVIAPAPKLST